MISNFGIFPILFLCQYYILITYVLYQSDTKNFFILEKCKKVYKSLKELQNFDGFI